METEPMEYNATDYTTGLVTPLYLALIFTFHIPLWILNVGGNSLVIFAVWRERSLRLPTYKLVFALAVADIALPLFAYPLSIYAVVVENQYTCSNGTRSYFFFLTYICAAASFFHIMAITFERYIGVTSPLSYYKTVTHRRIVFTVAFIWVLSFCLGILSLPIGRDDPLKPVCRSPGQSSRFTFLVVILCMIGMVVITFVYLKIYLIAKKHWKVMLIEREKAVTLSSAKKAEADENGNDDDAQLKATKTIGIIVVFFACCWLPMAARYLCEGVRDSIELSTTSWIIIKRTSETFGLLNGAINPIVYAHQNPHFRRAFKAAFKTMFTRLVCFRAKNWRKGSLAYLKDQPAASVMRETVSASEGLSPCKFHVLTEDTYV
ncbi:adenosine receptor A2b-like [Diadema antillarum]|uniref:adenosine receptor A2b-like n=1 Tax=Diadema antillarum TaxID=105358 RepID=UPI003A84DF00